MKTHTHTHKHTQNEIEKRERARSSLCRRQEIKTAHYVQWFPLLKSPAGVALFRIVELLLPLSVSDTLALVASDCKSSSDNSE